MSNKCKGKVFYDVDEQFSSGSIGVICDACKLSKHIVIVLSNETWSRSWCVGAIVGAFLADIPMYSVELDDDRADACFQDLEMSDEAIAVLGKQAPRDMLRPLGICDTDIPKAMKAVLQ